MKYESIYETEMGAKSTSSFTNIWSKLLYFDQPKFMEKEF